MNETTEDYHIFVSYYEYTADDKAERIYRVLTDAGYKVFVAHLERPRRSGNFEKYVDDAIASSDTFIFINTINALSRPQIIREFKQSFPNGDLTTRNLWVFKHDMDDIPHGSEDFKKQTNIDLSLENQTPFKTLAELAYSALSRCKKKRLEKSSVNEFVKKDVKLDEEQRKEYSELLHEKTFAKEFVKHGYIAEFQREIGNHLSADLILQKNNQWIICEFKTNAEKISNKIFSQLLKYKNEVEHIDKNILTELWLIGNGIFSESLKHESKKYNIKVIDDSNIHEVLGEELVHISIPKSIILYGESMKINFQVDKIKNEPIQLKIKNEKGIIITEQTFDVKSTNWIEYEIIAEGDNWKVPGELFSIIVEYGGKSALATIWRSNFGAALELDQKVYTWTDKVYITLVAPDFTHNETLQIDVSTNESKILNYKLKQTGKETGIFTGEIRLSGLKKYFSSHPKYLKDFLGTTMGNGPFNGLIACNKDDGIQTSFRLSEKEHVVANALVKWNIGEIQWVDASYPINGIGRIRVIDPDMNLNPDEIDTIEVKVWSDSDVIKKSIILNETHANTGIFEGEIKFDSKKSNESVLRVSEGDTIIAEYVDYTLPDPYTSSDELQIAGTATIGQIIFPLERFTISNLKFLDENKNEITELISGESLYISATIKNNQDRVQKYAFISQIKEDDITSLIGIQTGILKSHESKIDFIKWIPEFGGSYILSAYVWEDVDNPSALCSPLVKEISISGKTAKDLGFTKPLFEQRPEITRISKKAKLVIIPLGTSVPGCEKTGKCYIPSVLEIKLNEEVVWQNNDTAAHTITSGTPDMGPDGEFDSSFFMSGTTFSHRFTQKGKYPYFDMTHPWQTGVIIVK
ncbi:MAG TPA: TIR domain-containing protein [Nitrosopumilaceae archaeon]|nr:TIR domain-containing protein [Nitrosopumilaceae archaeon]